MTLTIVPLAAEAVGEGGKSFWETAYPIIPHPGELIFGLIALAILYWVVRSKVVPRLEEIYAEKHPEDLPRLRQDLDSTAEVLAEILTRNVFPGMNIEWGTYKSNIAHFDEEGDFAETGCFRCHDEEHVSEDGKVISQDCDACHVLLAEREDIDSLPEFVLDFITQDR